MTASSNQTINEWHIKTEEEEEEEEEEKKEDWRPALTNEMIIVNTSIEIEEVSNNEDEDGDSVYAGCRWW